MTDTKADAKWRDFAPHAVEDIAGVPQGAATVSLGGLHCDGCGEAHFVIAIQRKTGSALLAALSADDAIAFVKAGVDILGELGAPLIALQAMRSITVVSQLASMTDTECDFLDGSGVREWCRTVLESKAATFPRMYDSADEQRAIDALRAAVLAPHKPSVLSGTILADRGDLRWAVRAVAEALGMKPAF